MRRRILGPAAATVLVAAAGVPAAPAAPASASALACAGASGVTVVVDYNEAGGPTRAGCDPDGGGKSAASVFEAAGFSLEYHPRQPGYVCKVTGLPDDRPCLENDSFWSLWWSDGESGTWVFSNQGVGGLTVPDGGSVAFAWHEGGGNAQPPDHAPVKHEEPDPTDDDGTNTDDPDDDGNGGGRGPGGSEQPTGSTSATTSAPTTTEPTSTASESVSPDKRKKRRDRESPSESATTSSAVLDAADITDGPPPSDLATDTSGDEDSALPTWIGLGVAVLVLGAAGLVTVLRRRTG